MKMWSLFSAVFFLSNVASAMSIDWSGTYRAEWMQLNRPTLGTPSGAKAYGLHYLALNPRIIASDGINIQGRLDLLGNWDAAYENSQVGQIFGSSPGSRSDSRTMDYSPVRVSELYMTLEQEYGSLLVGRAPYEFGLGMLYNAGNGPFDHWLETADYVAYKFIVGNMSFMPMVGRISAQGPNASNVVQEELIEVKYENKDTGSMIGAMMARRKSSDVSNRAQNDPSVEMIGGQNATVTGGYSMETTGFTLGRSWDRFRFKMEAQFMKGNYGITNAQGEDVGLSSYGIAVDMEFPRPESTWDMGLRMGVASGDDPGTASHETFFFNRNYEVAMLLFNHRLGSSDLLGTGIIKDNGKSVSNSLDDETIANVIYFSPTHRYAWSPRLNIVNTLTYAQLMSNTQDLPGLSKDLGIEWDIGLQYRPRENVLWDNRIGLLFPGGAFRNGDMDSDNGFTYGFQSRAAITF